ncbi:hypothetical protein H6P81_002246 [Aristolochia fimbriata]|uniref:Uncharacterized protein n=1 Tax=Aristolochia fimbriata TaxID=158543 RepID=A0AAV7F9X9_ARIFI|nr:hypothetical protein H6P81_002246 [Aristolochia fimbriata]
MQESSSDEEGSSLPGYFHFDQKATRDTLLRLIITGDCPLSLVESSYFREFISSMQPLVQHVDSEDIKNDIMNMYNLLMLEVQDILHKSPGRVAITTEMWTSCDENQDSVYMAIAVQFIDECGLLRKRLIRFAHVPFPDDPEFE